MIETTRFSSADHGPFDSLEPAVPALVVQLMPARGVIESISDAGLLRVSIDASVYLDCEVLGSLLVDPLQVGDIVLVTSLAGRTTGVVLGRIVPYTFPRPMPQVTIEATESLTLKCGAASIDLRADGKVMVRGEDVLLRAKGTQRIRAGTVSIN